ncbi:XRE family transcriptional regulator [Litoreibacter roseus]|uniref:XRE family transcriptional regulator n=1 Tax=Litoreibacter roseus TaxID=2601869 RepID=A0A6N6JN08_9RHOB|nr:XRE family transcriptional regulator [Litoreibacter roseus]GFE66738.1 XRE family transcriptional regulator [Litoreibacter roseus]
MPRSALAGTRIRESRMALGLKQADLAAQTGISASYLNLIEHNKRRIGGKLLVSIAGVLGRDPNMLAQGGESALIEGLQNAAGPSDGAEIDQIEEFVGRFPGWAEKITAQAQRIAALEATVGGLNDRLTHDPVLSEKMHDVLGSVSAIRSTASILVTTPDIGADWRARFHANIDAESRRLAETSAGMASHFDRLARRDSGFATPLEQVSAFFERRRYHIAEIEADGPVVIPDILANSPEFESDAARSVAGTALKIYARDVERLPLVTFGAAARATRFDPAALAREFKVDLMVVFRRLASLPIAADMPEVGLVICDSAGAMLFRKPPPGFGLPRFGAACPLWPLFSALSTPGQPIRRDVESTENRKFRTYAVTSPVGMPSFEGPPLYHAAMLLISDEDGVQNPRPVGSSCRVCPRPDCVARREPSILQVD